MDCSLPFLKLTRRIRVPFLSHFLLLLFVHNCSLFLLRFVLFLFSLSFFAASCLHFVLLFWNQTFTRVSDKPSMAPIWSRPCLVTYVVAWKRFSRPRRCSCVKTGRHQGSLRKLRAGGSLRWKCAWAGCLHFTETGNRENELLGVLKMIIRLN